MPAKEVFLPHEDFCGSCGHQSTRERREKVHGIVVQQPGAFERRADQAVEKQSENAASAAQCNLDRGEMKDRSAEQGDD